MNKEGATIRAIAIAGVGRSTLGTAALARNVADALGIDVAGIIAGYGVSDVMTEALGGWLAFGAADRISHMIEKFFDRLPGDNEVSTLAEILLADPPKLELLVAHGKGALVARSALEQYVDDLKGDESGMFKRLRVTTLGSVVELPAQFKAVKQYLGAFD
jgi:hypothetical protein